MSLNYIEELIDHKTPVAIYLVNGVKLQGTITGMQLTPIAGYLLEARGKTQFVHMTSVSTVAPMAHSEPHVHAA